MEWTMRRVERHVLVRVSSRTETTPLSLSNELCGKLREERLDETADFADARAKAARLCSITKVLNRQRILFSVDRCQHILFAKRRMTKSGLLPTHTFINIKNI